MATSVLKGLLSYPRQFWHTWVIFLAPLLLLPIVFAEGGSREMRCLYVLCITIVFWATECLPLPVSSLVPIVLLPAFGVVDTTEVTMVFFKSANITVLGGLIVALAIEFCNLHTRIALRMLLIVGGSTIPRILFSMMMTTGFLSFWISNTASIAMMAPVIDAVVKTHARLLRRKHLVGDGTPERNLLMLGISYATNIGGTAVIIGTPSNFVLMAEFAGAKTGPGFDDTRMSFLYWIIFAMPLAILQIGLAWLFLVFCGRWLDFTSRHGDVAVDLKASTTLELKDAQKIIEPTTENMDEGTETTHEDLEAIETTTKNMGEETETPREDLEVSSDKPDEEKSEEEPNMMTMVREQYNELGPMSTHEKSVLFVFVLLILLWVSSKPKFVSGWGDALQAAWPKNPDGRNAVIDSAVPATLAVILLFILPQNYKFWPFQSWNEEIKSSPSLISWNYISKNLSWGVILLLGSGFTLSQAMKTSGLTKWMGEKIDSGFGSVEEMPRNIIITIITTALTQVIVNVGAASIIVPIMTSVSLAKCENPLYTVLPATLCASYSFMLPISTAPNVIMYENSSIKVTTVILSGLVIAIMCVTTVNLAINSYGVPLFDLNYFPNWGNTISTPPTTCPREIVN